MRPQPNVKGRNDNYDILQPLGNAGLYGQAFLCRSVSNGKEYVAKFLKPGAPDDGPAVLEREARTLERIAAAEDRRQWRYAVRLIDRSSDMPITFIVMERAVGRNVLEDVLGDIRNWETGGLAEHEALIIARHLAQALVCVHSAELLYDDMKLDNLFWQDGNLRIIDWNVVSEIASRPEQGVSGDWARFGARLYELRTGERIGLDSNAQIVSAGPSGPRWKNLPAGVRDIINQALALNYRNDMTILADLTREYEFLQLEQQNDWDGLLRKAELAAGEERPQAIAMLAPLDRAERLLALMPEQERDLAIERVNNIRYQIDLASGRATTSSMASAFKLLSSGNTSLARGNFQKAYHASGGNDPRPRRGLWLVQIAEQQSELYVAAATDLERALELLSSDDALTEDVRSARRRIEFHEASLKGIQAYEWLSLESQMLVFERDGDLGSAISILERLRERGALRDAIDLQLRFDLLDRKRKDFNNQQQLIQERQELETDLKQAITKAQTADLEGKLDEAKQQYQQVVVLMQKLDVDNHRCKWYEAHFNRLNQLVELEKMRPVADIAYTDLAPLQRLTERVCSMDVVPEVVAEIVKRMQSVITQLERDLANSKLLEQRHNEVRKGWELLQEGVASIKSNMTTLQTSLNHNHSPNVANVSGNITMDVIGLLPQIEGVRALLEKGRLNEATQRIKHIRSQVDFYELRYLEREIKQRHETAEVIRTELAEKIERKDFVEFTGLAEQLQQLLQTEADNNADYTLVSQSHERLIKHLKNYDQLRGAEPTTTIKQIVKELSNTDYLGFYRLILTDILAHYRDTQGDGKQVTKTALGELRESAVATAAICHAAYHAQRALEQGNSGKTQLTTLLDRINKRAADFPNIISKVRSHVEGSPSAPLESSSARHENMVVKKQARNK